MGPARQLHESAQAAAVAGNPFGGEQFEPDLWEEALKRPNGMVGHVFMINGVEQNIFEYIHKIGHLKDKYPAGGKQVRDAARAYRIDFSRSQRSM